MDPERRRQVFLESHFTEIGNHLGQKKTVHRIQSRYYWLGIVKDVVDWVSGEHRLWLCHQRIPKGSGRRPQGAAGGALMQGGFVSGARALKPSARWNCWNGLRQLGKLGVFPQSLRKPAQVGILMQGTFGQDGNVGLALSRMGSCQSSSGH